VVGGIYSPNHQTSRLVRLSVRWRTGQSGAHRTCPVRQPRHQKAVGSTVGALSSGPAWMSGGAPDMHCRLSGAPAPACLTTARFWRALNASQVAVGAEIAVAPLLHWIVRCTPDSPVNFSGAAEVKTRGWRVPEAALPWSTGHVRCTPDSPVNFRGAAEVKTRGWRVPEAALPWSTGHVRCTPDSPVNYSRVASGNSRR
jgi:hypothetical protein